MDPYLRMSLTFPKRYIMLERLTCKIDSLIHYIFLIVDFIIRGGSDRKHMPQDPPNLVWNGFHGYDSSHPDMRTIFMAKGPSFKKHYEGQPLELVDIYQLYAHILAIPPQPNNGTWANVRSYLANGSNHLAASFVPVIAALMAAFARP